MLRSLIYASVSLLERCNIEKCGSQHVATCITLEKFNHFHNQACSLDIFSYSLHINGLIKISITAIPSAVSRRQLVVNDMTPDSTKLQYTSRCRPYTKNDKLDH